MNIFIWAVARIIMCYMKMSSTWFYFVCVLPPNGCHYWLTPSKHHLRTLTQIFALTAQSGSSDCMLQSPVCVAGMVHVADLPHMAIMLCCHTKALCVTSGSVKKSHTFTSSLVLHYFATQLCHMTVKLDNTTLVTYLNRQGDMRSSSLHRMAADWQRYLICLQHWLRLWVLFEGPVLGWHLMIW